MTYTTGQKDQPWSWKAEWQKVLEQHEVETEDGRRFIEGLDE